VLVAWIAAASNRNSARQVPTSDKETS